MNTRLLSTAALSFAAGCLVMWLVLRNAATDPAPAPPAVVASQPDIPRAPPAATPAPAVATTPAPAPAAGTPRAEDEQPTPADAPAPPAEGALRIGAWNIENLGTNKKLNQKPEDLAAYILSSGVSVLALEEIHDDDQPDDDTPGHAPWQNAILNEALAILEKSTGSPWQSALTAPSESNRRQQMTGVAWNTGRASLKNRFVIPVEGGMFNNDANLTHWTRQPEAFQFSAGEGKTDFVLVPLHMKSNSGREKNGPGMRITEATQLKSKLSAVTAQFAGEADIVLLGDTNILPGEREVSDTWAPEFKDLNAAGRYTYIKPYRNEPFPPFDRIFVPAGQPEFAASVQGIHGPYGDGRDVRRAWRDNHLSTRSDHLLVYTDLLIQADDD